MEEQASIEQLELVEEDLEHLKQLYASYQAGLKKLHQITGEYKKKRQNIKEKLRLQRRAAKANGYCRIITRK